MKVKQRYWHPDAFDWMGDLAWAAHARVYGGASAKDGWAASHRRRKQQQAYANTRATGVRAVDAWIARGMVPR